MAQEGRACLEGRGGGESGCGWGGARVVRAGRVPVRVVASRFSGGSHLPSEHRASANPERRGNNLKHLKDVCLEDRARNWSDGLIGVIFARQQRGACHKNVQRFRGGLVLQAHRLCVSLNSRLDNNNEEEGGVPARAKALMMQAMSEHSTCSGCKIHD